jgi:NADPH2:quinone reductase
MESHDVVFTAPSRAELITRPVDELGPTEIMIEADVSLVSAGTERSAYRQAPSYPFPPGYSLVGRVAKTGPQVTRFAVGDRVAASASHGSLVACEEIMAFGVPDTVSNEHATFLTVGATALYAVQLARISLGEPALILGQGLIGLLATQLARSAGAVPVIGTDLDPARLELARSLGADHALHAEDVDSLRAVLADLPGGGVAAAIDLSGADRALDLAVSATRRRGRVVAAALNFTGGGTVDLYGEAFLKGISLTGAYFNARPWRLDSTDLTPPTDWPPRPVATTEFEALDVPTSASDTAMVLRLLEHGRLQVAPLITDEVDFRDAPALYDRLLTSATLGALIRW